ncbi:splicing factor 3B subunit 4-like [Cuculus canorus]|uniref:splicing factor 3B subunit 4-like n=1 Tax=Cuculus canorus TaxID=55661 RepID=UPI0023AAB744|nr:splicing factor 3B subunit 4-like [Cuculus canorus]
MFRPGVHFSSFPVPLPRRREALPAGQARRAPGGPASLGAGGRPRAAGRDGTGPAGPTIAAPPPLAAAAATSPMTGPGADRSVRRGVRGGGTAHAPPPPPRGAPRPGHGGAHGAVPPGVFGLAAGL